MTDETKPVEDDEGDVVGVASSHEPFQSVYWMNDDGTAEIVLEYETEWVVYHTGFELRRVIPHPPDGPPYESTIEMARDPDEVPDEYRNDD